MSAIVWGSDRVGAADGAKAAASVYRNSRLRRRRGSRPPIAVALWAAVCLPSSVAYAQSTPQVVVPSGLPVQVKATYPEIGVTFSFPTGGTSTSGGAGGTGDTSGSTVGDTSGSGGSAYNTMMAQSWGTAAENAAMAMGVNPTALAATCVMESGCQNTPAGSSGSASGAFQMINSTYTADIAAAVAADPSIADSVTPGLAGKMDPGTEAYAAAYELMNDAQVLQNNGIADPTVLQTRAIYQFGQTGGIQVATASPSDNLEALVNLSPQNMAANGITSTTTVGQWQATIANKLGSAANQVVLATN
ncbi:MAG: hypothetical protein ACLP4V_02310 [Methylocella sp.]